MRRSTRLAAGGSALALAAAVGAGPARAATDVTTFGYDLQRTGLNPQETVIGPGNAGALAPQWSAATGKLILLTQPLVAAGVAAEGGGTRDLVYVGSRRGGLVAVDRATGAVVWKAIGSGRLNGVIGTPTLDRAGRTLYAATWGDDLHALDEATGKERPGWPVHLTPANLTNDRVFAGLTLVGRKLYAEVASANDQPPYRGEVVEMDVSARKVVHTWFSGGTSGLFGGGLWGMGGVSVEPDGSALYAATGNGFGKDEHAAFFDQVVRLGPTLKLQAANYPGLSGLDVDFGATPLPYQAPGCPARLAVMNKTGALLVYDRAAIGEGPRQRLQMADSRFSSAGDFIGVPAYDPARRLVYVNNPSDSRDGKFKHGLVALKVGADCDLSVKWQTVLGPPRKSGQEHASIPPTVANGVVYAVRSVDSTVYALDAATGAQLWSSGTQISGGIFGAVTVANGQLLVPAVNGTLYAFAPSSPHG